MASIKVYIDGACTNNGKPNAKAGYGVFFSDDDPRNESDTVTGKQSNNTGELTALIRCLEILEKERKENKVIDIYTDSEYVIKCATTYGTKVERNGWKTSTGKQVPNLELVKRAHQLFKESNYTRLHHIEAHTNKTDIHSLGNAGADRLACLSIGCMPDEQNDIHTASSPTSKPDITKLEWVSFNNKDKAKELGAKWNVSKKFWYIDASVPDEVMKGLLALKNTPSVESKPKSSSDEAKKIYIKVDFSKKNQAKALGARWDATVKSWYYVDSDISEDKKDALKRL